MDRKASFDMDVKWAIVTSVEATVFGRADRTRLTVKKDLVRGVLGQVACVAGLVGAGLFLPVNAQPVTPASAASAPTKDAAPSERVQREASDVFRWIKLHTDNPRKAPETKPAKATLATARVSTGTPSVPLVEVAGPKPVETEKPLKPISQPEPEFPADIMTALGKGSVTLRFVVQTDGTVSEPEVLSSSHRRLNPPALAAVALWRFEPILTPRQTQVELGFSLD